MDSNERRRYEGTGHGGSLESRLLAFRQATTRIVNRCAWCPQQPDAPVHVVLSHSICPTCAARVEREG